MLTKIRDVTLSNDFNLDDKVINEVAFRLICLLKDRIKSDFEIQNLYFWVFSNFLSEQNFASQFWDQINEIVA
jgi:hypothetical protein